MADTSSLRVASPEDVILEKLKWYRQGGHASDRQWSDMLGLASTRSLDWEYIERWANTLGVAEELTRLRQQL